MVGRRSVAFQAFQSFAFHSAIIWVWSEAAPTQYTMQVENTNINEAIRHGDLLIQFKDDNYPDFDPRVIETRVLGMLGLFNKGKTWLINNMFKVNLNSSYDSFGETKGVSMLHLKERNWLVLDTAGLQRPVSSRDRTGDADFECSEESYKKLREQCIRNKKNERMQADFVEIVHTERFLFDIVGRIADAIIFVVNDYTWYEQQELFALLQKSHNRGNGDKQKVMVAHVFKHIKTRDGLTKLFQKQLVQTIHSGNRPPDAKPHEAELHIEKYEFEKINNLVPAQTREVKHYAFGNANDPATFGRMNEAGFSEMVAFLTSEFPGKPPEGDFLSDKLERATEALLQNFAKCSNTTNTEVGDALFVGVQYIEENTPFRVAMLKFTPYNRTDMSDMSENCKLVPISEGVVDRMGRQLSQEKSFELPPPAIFEYGEDGYIYRVVAYEIPGVAKSKADIAIEDRNGVWEMKVNRKELPGTDGIKPAKVDNKEANIVRKKGSPEAVIPFQKMIWEFNPKKDVHINDGVMTLRARFIADDKDDEDKKE